MGVAASVSKFSRMDASSSLDASAFSRVQPVCNFVNAEAARLRNQTIAIGVACAVGAVLLPLVTGIGDPRIPLVLASGAFGFFFVRARSELAASCSNIAAKRFVSALSKQLTYKSSSSLTRQQFVAMDLFNGLGHRWKSQTEISGKARGLRYSLHQVQAGGKERKSVVFDGVVIKIDFNDNFPAHTVIVPDDDGQLPGARGGAGSRVKKDLVMLKSPAFERMFSVYAKDYYEARRLVTPKLMEVVMEAAPTFNSNLRLAFVQKSLFVAIGGDALRVNPALFSEPLTPQAAVGKLIQLVAFAEELAYALAE